MRRLQRSRIQEYSHSFVYSKKDVEAASVSISKQNENQNPA